MVEHERTHEHTGAAPDTDQLPVQSWPAAENVPQAPVEQAYNKARRTSAFWVRIAIAVVVLVVLLVFILENLQTASIGFFGAHLQLPLGVALLLASILGVVIVMVPSYSRIAQLRKTLRRASSGK